MNNGNKFSNDTIRDVMRFLLVNGFNQTTYETTEALSTTHLKELSIN